MTTRNIETDYLIVGAGAAGMAFADILLAETDATITLIDKRHKPGGHWNDAYSFVTLHQPSAFYGVSSKELSQGRLAPGGLNKGLHELATGAEIMAYYDDVMRNQFLPSGRVHYLPMCEYQGQQQGVGKAVSLTSGEQIEITINKKEVDCTYFGTNIPKTHKPSFEIADDVHFIPINDLPEISKPHSSYVVVGAGKTAMDAITWMLEHQIEADKITWIRPRDGWLINRKNTQPGEAFFNNTIGAQALQMKAIAESESIDDLFDKLEQAQILMRIDTDIKPQMFHGPTVSEAELEQLRKVKNVIRMGHITHINKTQTIFEQGKLDNAEDALFIDCSASAATLNPIVPVFGDNTITVQTVRSFQPVFSAAFIAHIEAAYSDQKKQNELCPVVPLPNHATDWILGTGAQMLNQFIWSQEPDLRDWIMSNRLDGFSALIRNVDKSDTEKMQILSMMKEHVPQAAEKLQKYAHEIQSQGRHY